MPLCKKLWQLLATQPTRKYPGGQTACHEPAAQDAPDCRHLHAEIGYGMELKHGHQFNSILHGAAWTDDDQTRPMDALTHEGVSL